MKCPKCRNKVLQKSGDSTYLRIKGKIELINGLCKAKCYWCGEYIEIPLNEQDKLEERFIIRK